jgi:hypothetical protein
VSDDEPVRARYVLGASVRLSPDAQDLQVEPATVEVTVHRAAATPGEDGWRFFRDNCWRGELNHPEHVRELLADELGVTVESVAFRELRTTEAYLEALRAAIAGELAAFNADGVDEVVHKYLGSSVHVVPAAEL